MAEAIARARFILLAPRKVRLVADQIRGKKVDEARATLAFTVLGGAGAGEAAGFGGGERGARRRNAAAD